MKYQYIILCLIVLNLASFYTDQASLANPSSTDNIAHQTQKTATLSELERQIALHIVLRFPATQLDITSSSIDLRYISNNYLFLSIPRQTFIDLSTHCQNQPDTAFTTKIDFLNLHISC